MNSCNVMILALVAMTAWTQATNVMVSTLNDVPSTLRAADGASLPAGCLAQLGTFAFTDELIEGTLNTTGILGVMAAMRPFGSAVAVGDGTNGVAGQLQVEVQETLPAEGNPHGDADMCLLVLNGPSAEASTEILLLRWDNRTIPPDGVGGLGGVLSVHVRDSVVVLGTSDPTQRRARMDDHATPFAKWIHAQLGDDDPLALSLTADADDDGESNLVEYALAGAAGDSSQSGRVDGLSEGVLTFPRLDVAADGRVDYTVEFTDDLRRPWIPLTNPLPREFDPSLPEGYTLARTTFSQDIRIFVRVRIAYLTDPGI